MSDSAPFTYDVFLSHSSKDKAIVRPLAERLRADGLRVWFDEWEIRPGDSRQEKIEEGLERSRVLVLCMSAHAFGSDWAQLESGTFRFRDPLNKDRRFLPLRLDAAEIRGSLAQFKYLDWQGGGREAAYAALREACRTAEPQAPPDQKEERECLPERIINLDYGGLVRCVEWSCDGRRALSGTFEGIVRLWDVDTECCQRAFKVPVGSIFSAAWSPDERYVLFGSCDKKVRLWDVETGSCLRVFKGHANDIQCVAWSPDGRRFLSAARNDTVRLWDVSTGRCLRVLDDEASLYTNSVAWSPNGRRALSGGWDAAVRMWDADTGHRLRVLEGHGGLVGSVKWSADGRSALSGADDGTVRLWDVESGRCLSVLKGHNGCVYTVAWSPGGRYALSGADDNTVRLWDVDTGLCLRVLKGQTGIEDIGIISDVAWSPDGRRALGCEQFGEMRIWNLSDLMEAPAVADSASEAR